MFAPAGWYFPALATGGSMVFLVGYMDDMSSLNPMIRLSVHLLAAGLMVLPFQQGSPFFILISVLWIAGCTNAYNLIDGMNGLSLSMAIVAMVSLAWDGAATFALPVVGLSSGVLFWNFPRARTFLGDGGVYLLGFVVANLILRWGAKMLSEAGPSLIPVMVLLGGVPVLDTLVTILRRLISRRSPFSPDRGHIHHRLLDMGLPVPVILVILSSLQMILFRLGVLLLSL
jgi:UDP-GlcNAc:undecaprenyl-phosphate GlcNAc-1-phosphate transferase